MFHPSRGGVRGGADQFEWEDVKVDKHRECYLGHSLKAPVGRWQKGKDLQWYTRGTQGASGGTHCNSKEKDAIRKMEADILAAALGKGPIKKPQGSLTKQELAEVCRKGQLERDSMDIERVEGMGFGRTRASLVEHVASPMKETMAAPAAAQVKSTKMATGDISEKKEMTKRPKHKKEKKHRKEKKKKKKHRGSDSSDEEKGSRGKRQRHDSESDGREDENKKKKKHRGSDSSHEEKGSRGKRQRHDSESDGREEERSQGRKKKGRKRHDSDSEDGRLAITRKPREDQRDHDRRSSRNDKQAKNHRRDTSDSDNERGMKPKYRKENRYRKER